MKLTLSSQERIDGKDTVVEERERPNIFLAGNSSPCRSTATDIKDVASDRNRVDDPHRLCTLVNWKIPRLPANSRARTEKRVLVE